MNRGKWEIVQIAVIMLLCMTMCITIPLIWGINDVPLQSNRIKVDSLTKHSDSLKITIKELEDIKDAKIIEVNSLDNDSTVKLFYELVKK